MNAAIKWFFLFIFCTHLWASDALPVWYAKGSDKKITLNVEMFLTSTCPHCHKADAFFKEVAAKLPYVTVHYNVINESKEALFHFHQLLSAESADDFIVPSIYFCDSRWVGFDSVETTGNSLMRALAYCKEQIEKEGSLTPATVDTLRHWANANKFTIDPMSHPSDAVYIAGVALTDAVAPCSFFIFIGFFAFLFIGETRRQRVRSGLLFILALGLAHYVQQAHTSIFYNILPWLRIPAILIGALALYFVVQCYKKQFKLALYYLLAFGVGLLISAYQQTCIMNWSFIFQQWLTNKHLPAIHTSFYQLLYQVLYILPMLLILLIYLLLLNLAVLTRNIPRMTTIGLLFLIALALLLIIYPMALSHLIISCILLLVLTIGGCIKYR